MGTYLRYPSHWWEIIEPQAPVEDWEILPHQAIKNQEVILSKRNELGLLSNFAATPFELHGKSYASVEGFWQMLKYPEGDFDFRLSQPEIQWPFSRDQVGQMTAFVAKDAGTKASENMKQLGINWVTYGGRKMDYWTAEKNEFYDLIFEVELAKVNQNLNVKKVLLSTGRLVLRPDHAQPENAPPAWKYHEIWMEIREKLS